MSLSPRAADGIRKACGYALAVAITILMFRVLGRAAKGTQRLADVELWAMAVLAAVAIAWVKAARRVRRGGPPPPGQ